MTAWHDLLTDAHDRSIQAPAYVWIVVFILVVRTSQRAGAARRWGALAFLCLCLTGLAYLAWDNSRSTFDRRIAAGYPFDSAVLAVTLALLWLACVVGVRRVARERGIWPGLWTIAAVATGPLALALVAGRQTRKRCPYCLVTLWQVAAVCRACGRDLPPYRRAIL